jgi:Putative ABC exporter
MNELAALAYADVRSAINGFRTLRKRPWRVVMWAVYAAVVVGLALLKTTPRTRTPHVPAFDLLMSDIWVCGIAVAFGIVLATGTSRWLGIFRSRAEALFLTRAESSAPLVATYLQTRAVLAALGVTAARFAYLIVVGIPGGTTLHALAAQLVFFAACGAAIVSVALPRALARGAAGAAAIVAGWTAVAVAVLPVALDGARMLKLPLAMPLLRAFPAIHPGAVLAMLAAGDLRPITIPLAVAAMAGIAFVLAARDAYPELYEISLANIEWRAQRQAKRGGGRAPSAERPRVTSAASSGEIRWRGAFALVWADALAFSRRVSPTVTAIVVAGALVAGAGLAAAARATDEGMLLGIVFGIVPAFYITIASTTGVRLAPVMRLPLFWLGDVPLVSRLAAWTLGALLRDLAVLGFALAGYVAVDRDPLVPAVLLIGGIGLLALTRAVGLAVFALLPNSLDQRGPAVFIRVILAFALIAPAVIGGLVAGFAFASVVAGTAAGSVLALAESGVLVGFAAWRLAGRVDLLATA